MDRSEVNLKKDNFLTRFYGAILDYAVGRSWMS